LSSDVTEEHGYIEFLVQGSAAKPYETTFTKDGDRLTATCTCPAGEYGQYCKHRFTILKGDSGAVVSDNKDEVSIVNRWLAGTELEEAICDLATAENNFEEAKRMRSAVKKQVARVMIG